MSNERFASVWDAIENTPAEAENMKLRSVLMMALKEHIARIGLSQSQAAKLFGVTQPRVSDLVRGKINLFGLDALVNMASAAGLHVECTCWTPHRTGAFWTLLLATLPKLLGDA
jgi:predicted XRE-type DNA-binding protein